MVIRLRGEKISERSLEFNVMSEMINSIRSIVRNAYIVGYTTRQEAYHGLDVSIDAPGSLVLGGYQFKAPSRKRANNYYFRIGDRCWICSNPRLGSPKNPRRKIIEALRKHGLPESCVNQHSILYMTSIILEQKLGTPVYYALPLIHTYSELEQRILNILDYTILIRVLDIPLRTVLDCTRHHIEITLPPTGPNNAIVNIYSEPIKIPKGKVKTLRETINEQLKKLNNLPKNLGPKHFNVEEVKAIVKQELERKIREEELSPELAEKARKLFSILAEEISFSYRGRAIVIKPSQQSQQK